VSNGPGKKDTEKIKFFKIDPSGDIAPAFPPNGLPREPGEASYPSALPAEPIFTLNENGSDVVITGLPQPEQNPAQERELDLLRPQVEDISRAAEEQELTYDQVEVLKKYISLKEAEVRDSREQHRQYQAFLKTLSSQVEQLNGRNRELLSELELTKRREDVLKTEAHTLKDRQTKEILLIRNDYEEKLRKSSNYELQMDELVKSREEWKQKVSEDLKRIKLKERELENKHELLKRDTQALLDSKDKHVLELKKKNDALELELESLEERLRKSHVILGAIESKKRRLIETMKLAMSLLEGIDNGDTESSDSQKDRKAG
jgi:chromosome segregation ATPase